MKTYKFDCNGNNAPAYSCNQPGDNSGFYFKASEVFPLIKAVKDILDAHEISMVDWNAIRRAKEVLEAHNKQL